MIEALDVFLERDDIAQIHVLLCTKDGVVHDNAVHVRVFVGSNHCGLELVAPWPTQLVGNAILLASATGHARVHFACRVLVGEETHKLWMTLARRDELRDRISDLQVERLRDSVLRVLTGCGPRHGTPTQAE